MANERGVAPACAGSRVFIKNVGRGTLKEKSVSDLSVNGRIAFKII
jgi:hypothetical protein